MAAALANFAIPGIHEDHVQHFAVAALFDHVQFESATVIFLPTCLAIVLNLDETKAASSALEVPYSGRITVRSSSTVLRVLVSVPLHDARAFAQQNLASVDGYDLPAADVDVRLTFSNSDAEMVSNKLKLISSFLTTQAQWKACRSSVEPSRPRADVATELVERIRNATSKSRPRAATVARDDVTVSDAVTIAAPRAENSVADPPAVGVANDEDDDCVIGDMLEAARPQRQGPQRPASPPKPRAASRACPTTSTSRTLSKRDAVHKAASHSRPCFGPAAGKKAPAVPRAVPTTSVPKRDASEDVEPEANVDSSQDSASDAIVASIVRQTKELAKWKARCRAESSALAELRDCVARTLASAAANRAVRDAALKRRIATATVALHSAISTAVAGFTTQLTELLQAEVASATDDFTPLRETGAA